MKKLLVVLVSVCFLGVLSGCSSDVKNTQSTTSAAHNMHESMALPAGIKEAASPKFKVGSPVVIKADHHAGMNGAKGTVSGAYDTYIYAVSYTPTTGGEKVTNHKWVVQEELLNFGTEPFKVGQEVTLNAEHMEGMKGAKATVDSVTKGTIYAVDYMPTNGGEMVKNHFWVSEDELSDK